MESNLTQIRQLDTKDSIELTLEIFSFAGGENTIGQDQELKSNEARVIENWDSDSFGGMIRTKGFSRIANGGASYSVAPDLLLHHFEGTTVRNLVGIGGDLAYINGSAITQLTAAALASGILTHGVSAGGSAWMTNSTNNLKRYTISGGLVTPSNQPAEAMERIYEHKSRLVAEGGSRTVYGSRGGSGNWSSGTAWTASGDAWSSTLPDLTQGCGIGFPSGNEISVFTKFGVFVLNGFPNVGFRPIPAGHGCGAPYSIALGTEGLYFLSNYPTLGIYLWDGVNFNNLTINEDWIRKVNLNARIFGVYRENKYLVYYNEIGSAAVVPNRCKYYDARWGKWASRVINPLLGDNFGYPIVATKSSNELFVASSSQANIYQMEDESNGDNGFPTKANYRTKDFTSLDFGLDIDELTLKLIKAVITYYGSKDTFSLQWGANRGQRSGNMVFDLNIQGASLLNTNFLLNSSYLAASPPDKTTTRKFSNNAIGERFDFQLLNSSIGDRTKIKKVKIVAIVVGERQDMTFKTPSSGIGSTTDSLINPDEQLVLTETGQTIEIS